MHVCIMGINSASLIINGVIYALRTSFQPDSGDVNTFMSRPILSNMSILLFIAFAC